LLDRLIEIAREAGRAVLDVYGSGDVEVSYKSDSSPLTEADRRSHEVIQKGIVELAPDIPLLSEEGAGADYAVRCAWERFFLVDPLDGTKEFVKRNGEFTVNIALIEGKGPGRGVVYVPVRDVFYYSRQGGGAYRQEGGDPPRRIHVKEGPGSDGLVVVASRSHGSEALEDFLKTVRVKARISAGSSLKFCLVADGTADIYPRFGPTWEWDTAAGHAIVLEAGGVVVDTGGGELAYNKEVLKHKGFIAASALPPM
jgi:3'(2'), 5'-bisphosphate nucleotidase